MAVTSAIAGPMAIRISSLGMVSRITAMAGTIVSMSSGSIADELGIPNNGCNSRWRVRSAIWNKAAELAQELRFTFDGDFL